MISVIVAEPIDIDAGEMADFGGGQADHGRSYSAAQAHRLTSVMSGLAIRKADVCQCRAEKPNEVAIMHGAICVDSAARGD